MKNFAMLSVVSMLFLAGAGCQSGVPPYTEGRAEPFVPPQVILAGREAEDLHQRTVIDRPILERDSADLLRVTLYVRGTSDLQLHTQYRVTFLDDGGNPLPGSPTGWFRKTLVPGAREAITFNSTSPRAKDFQMELRYAE